MANLKLKHIYKVYEGGVKAVSDLNLEISDKDFVVFVGPSGCGKTTTLRMIAGLEDITSGQLYIDDVLVNELPPKDRNISMVFQNYALYPHMTVFDNMAFGLKLAHVDKDEIKRRIDNAAEILGLTPYLSRKPKALSGGQRQRVALGRSIVREPKVFLLDEPLSNLDAKLRVQMRSEITKLHRRLNTTFIYVTHDQTEALTMGSKIVVMRDGLIQQIDTPTNLYDHPANIFTATFLGTPQMNIFDAKLVQEGNKFYAIISKGDSSYRLPLHENTIHQLISFKYIGKDIKLGIRPEELYQCEEHDKDDDSIVPLRVEAIEKLGSELVLYGNIEETDIPLVAKIDGRNEIREGDLINVKFHTHHIHLFDKDTENRISGLTNFNYFEGKYNEDSHEISFLNNTYTITEEDAGHILPSYRNNCLDIVIRIPTNKLFIERQHDDDLEISAKVQIIEKSKDSMLVYVQSKGNETYYAVKLPISDLKVGDILTLYVNKEDIVLLNESMNTSLTALYPFPSNVIPCHVNNNGKGAVRLNIFHQNVLLNQDVPTGNYLVHIPYDALTACFNKKDRIKHQNINLKFDNESSLLSSTILYHNLPNVDDYLAFIVDKNVTCFKKYKYGFNIDTDKLEFQAIE